MGKKRTKDEEAPRADLDLALAEQDAQQKRARRALDALCNRLTDGGARPEAVLGAIVEILADLIMAQDEPESLLGTIVTGLAVQSTASPELQQRRRQEAKLMFEDAQGSA